jgi:HEAT repeat protein
MKQTVRAATRRAALVAAGVLVLASALCRAGEPDFSKASLEELFFHAQRYATTELKKKNKQRARETFFARKGEALDYLMSRIHTENMGYAILGEQLTRELKAEEAVPVLIRHVKSEHARTRKMAAFLLGFHEAPQEVERLLPLLDDEEAAGAAIRALGKWRVKDALPRIVPFLTHKDERRRVAAANALRDIGSPEAVPHLAGALQDRVFTVRRTAGRALAALGEPAERYLLEALPRADRVAQREMIRILGAMKSQKAVEPLRGLLRHEEALVREDAVRALCEIAPDRAGEWGKESGLALEELSPEKPAPEARKEEKSSRQ